MGLHLISKCFLTKKYVEPNTYVTEEHDVSEHGSSSWQVQQFPRESCHHQVALTPSWFRRSFTPRAEQRELPRKKKRRRRREIHRQPAYEDCHSEAHYVGLWCSGARPGLLVLISITTKLDSRLNRSTDRSKTPSPLTVTQIETVSLQTDIFAPWLRFDHPASWTTEAADGRLIPPFKS